MSHFYHLKIAQKLMVAFLLILALTIVLGVSSLRQAGKIDAAAGAPSAPSLESPLP